MSAAERSTTRGGNLRGADGVRAMACLMVMGHHAFQRLNLPAMPEWFQPFQYFFLQGNVGVSAFFVLSGFLLASPFWDAWLGGRKMPSLLVYTGRRAARIMPGYYVSLLLTFALSILFVDRLYEPVTRLVAGLTFTAGFSWVSFFPVEINGPLWSIGFEVFSYLLLPFFMLGLFKLPFFAGASGRKPAIGLGWWLGVLALVMVVNEWVQVAFATDSAMKGWQYGMVGGAKYWMPHYNPWGFFGHYALGIIAAGAVVILERGKTATAPVADGRDGSAVSGAGLRGQPAADLLALLSFLGIIGLLWAMKQSPEFALSVGSQPYYFPLFPALIAALLVSLTQSRWSWRIWDNVVFRFIARISFGLYIWHYLIMELTNYIYEPDYRYFGISDPLHWGLVTGACFTLAAVLATLSWYFMEKRVLDWAKAREKRSRKGTPAAAG